MHWMRKWPGGFPVFVREAKGARFVDVDGIEYVDFCLGDTGAMTGHAPDATLKAVTDQSAKGITLMLPSEDALVGLRRADSPIRRLLLAVRAHGDRREPLHDPARTSLD